MKHQKSTRARPIQVGQQIRQILSRMLLEGELREPRLAKANLITVTDVRMTDDLRTARVLVSIYPETEEVVAEVMIGLSKGRKEMQRAIASEMSLRTVPQVVLLLDDSIAQGSRIEQLLLEINREVNARPKSEEDE